MVEDIKEDDDGDEETGDDEKNGERTASKSRLGIEDGHCSKIFLTVFRNNSYCVLQATSSAQMIISKALPLTVLYLNGMYEIKRKGEEKTSIDNHQSIDLDSYNSEVCKVFDECS